MKKNSLLPDDIWTFPSDDPGIGRAALPPGGAADTLFVDEGEPYALAADTGGTTGLVVGAAKPVATIAQLADYLVNGFWQYNGTVAHHFTSSTITYNISALNAAEQFLAVSAMQAWHDVANINFVQTSGAANITFSNSGSMQAYTSAAWYSSGAIAYANVVISSDWITNDGGAYDGKTGIDSYGYQTYIHEIGHALGLGHQGPYNGSASYSTNAVYANDTWQYSIMSYFPENNYSGSSYRYVVTPQMADIYAMASIYGTPTSTRTGDTVYGFNSNAGAVFGFGNYTSAPALTIYDSSGTDTLDCSGYSNAQIIDLRAGTFSSVGGLVNNVGIALGVTIEKAIGGSGNDTMIANNAGCTLTGGVGNDTLIGGSGNDRLLGGSGVDTLTGGGGADTFVFAFGESSAASGQHDRITDFSIGVDRVDLSGIDAIVGTAGIDLFQFIAAAGFNGVAGQLNYFYNSSLGVTTLQGDVNGDMVADFAIDLTGNVAINTADITGAVAVPVVIEGLGATTLTQLGASYYFYANGTSSGPTLKYGGVAVTAGQFNPYVPVAAEQISGGYQVAMKDAAGNQFSIWNTDSNGNFVSFAVYSGNSASLKSLEASFQQDLNGDGTIGIPSIVIETVGSTSLVQVNGNFYLNNIASGSGPTLKYGSVAITAGQFDPYIPVGVEQTAGGYQVALKDAAGNQFSIWNTDSNGSFVSYAVHSGNSAALKSLETSFLQDLNGDGTIGVANVVNTVIEALGSTSLVQINSNYYFNSISSGSGPSLKYAGSMVSAEQFAPYTPVGVEQSGGGYQLAFKNSGNDQFLIWNTDANGNFVSYSALLGSSTALKSLETSFQQDLNGDGTIGVPSVAATVIEALGSTSLVQLNGNYYFNSISSGSGPSLKYGGSMVSAGQFAPFTPVGVEQSGGGYQLVFKSAGSDQFSIWNTDANGSFVSYSALSGSSTALKSLETSFQQDLNGDGTIGVPSVAATVIEAQGSTSLVQLNGNYYFNSISSGPSLKYGGSMVSAGQFAPYTPVGVEQSGGGYQLVFKSAGSDQFSIWTTDANGNFASYIALSGSSTALKSLETSFQQDLNGDGTIGIASGLAPALVSLNFGSDDGAFLFKPDAAAGLGVPPIAEKFECSWWSPGNGINLGSKLDGVFESSPLLAEATLHPSFNPPGHDIKLAFAAVLESDFFLR